MRRALKAGAWVAGVLLLATGLIGFAHTRPGRPLRPLLGFMMKARRGGGACPFGFDQAATPEARDAARRQFAATHHGSVAAGARPALGFVLDESTRADVLRWASAHAVKCARPASGPDLECVEVAAAALPEKFRGANVQSLWLYFGAGDRLISIVSVRKSAAAATIGDTFASLSNELSARAGAPAQTRGSASPGWLSAGLLRQAVVEYRFTDYYAAARATNMGDRFVLTEEYRSLPN